MIHHWFLFWMCKEENEGDKAAEVPKRVSLVAAILERCSQLLPQCQEQVLYASLMQTVRFSLDILSPFENVFLPKVHQLWTPLQHQLCSDCHLRQRQALQVLMVLVRSCPNFLRHRIVNEVLPHLLTFLESQAVSSHGKRRKAHVLTQAFKLQKLLLQETATLVQCLSLPVREVSKLLRTIYLYLSCHQLPELQASIQLMSSVLNSYLIFFFWFLKICLQMLAKENIEAISKSNAGAVWAVLTCLIPERILSRPGMKSIQV